MKIKIKREIFLIVSILAIIILLSGAFFYLFELGKNPQIASFWDALWLAAMTASTTGYGDVHPVTHAGKILAAFLSFSGLFMVGITSALATSYLLGVRK